MSFTPVAPSGKPRPNVVTYAVWLMWAIVGLHVLQVLLSFVPTPELDRKLDEFYAANPSFDQGGSSTFVILSLGIAAAIIAGFSALAVFVGRGSQPARIVTWVLSSVFALCLGCSLGLTLMPLNSGSTTATPTATASAGASPAPKSDTELIQELNTILQEHTPAWLSTLTTVLNVANVAGLVAVIILLALPAANEYFRREAAPWVPPTAGGGEGYPRTPPPAVPPKQ